MNINIKNVAKLIWKCDSVEVDGFVKCAQRSVLEVAVRRLCRMLFSVYHHPWGRLSSFYHNALNSCP